MRIEVTRVDVQEIIPLRELHRHEMHCQIVHDSLPRRGCSDAYLVQVDGRRAGYGLVANQHTPDTADEFYLIAAYRAAARPIFQALLEVSRATTIRAQTNDRLMLLMLYDFGRQITSDVLIFADGFTSRLACPDPDALLRKTDDSDSQDWALQIADTVVATGGLLFHYNPPFGDIYMDVPEAHRQRGFGSYLVQELKRIAYEIGRIPAARCGATNEASRRTLQKAGMLQCGRILRAEVASADVTAGAAAAAQAAAAPDAAAPGAVTPAVTAAPDADAPAADGTAADEGTARTDG